MSESATHAANLYVSEDGVISNLAADRHLEEVAGGIWANLSSIDVNDYTSKKGNLTYLSWAWAWGIMTDHYPGFVVEWLESITFPDKSLMVVCEVTIRGVTRRMWLPVMDNRNKAIPNPSSRDVSDAMMRCLTKCFAMFGLGHYIYAGEDLPVQGIKSADEVAASMVKSLTALGKRAGALGVNFSKAQREDIRAAMESGNEGLLTAAIGQVKAAIDLHESTQ